MTARKRLVIALLCGLLGSACMGLFLWNQGRSVERTRTELINQFDTKAVKVLVAKRRIEAGTVLEERHFDEQLWPSLFVPEGAILAEHAATVLGHRSAAAILRGEALTAARVFEQELALDRLSEGMCAVTLPTDAVHALGGELICGMRVTLMGVMSDGRVEAIAHDIELLSTNTATSSEDGQGADTGERATLLGGQQAGKHGETINWVTLALPDEQVRQVLAASQARTLHLVLPKTTQSRVDDGTSEDERL